MCVILFCEPKSTPASYMKGFLAEVSKLSPQLLLIPKLDGFRIITVAFVVPINSYPENQKGSTARMSYRKL